MASANFYFLENLEDKYQGPVNLRESDRGSDHIPGKQYAHPPQPPPRSAPGSYVIR